MKNGGDMKLRVLLVTRSHPESQSCAYYSRKFLRISEVNMLTEDISLNLNMKMKVVHMF
jgi:hypothetical protein